MAHQNDYRLSPTVVEEISRLGLEQNLAQGFTVFDFPLEHWRTVRTTNSLQRINREIRSRTRVVGIIPNEAACLHLVSALLMEISDEWQIGKKYCAGKSSNC